MCVAHEVSPILADELIADKIQGRRHVPAPIHGRHESVHHHSLKTGHAVLLANNREFLYFPGSTSATRATTFPRRGFPATCAACRVKKRPVNRQANKIGDQKKRER